MIFLNLMIPNSSRHEIENKENDTFRIITSLRGRTSQLRFFIIETTEEEATFLALKYGLDNVWKR